MRCATIQKQLDRHHDGELPSEARAEIERHLAACAECRTAVARLEAVRGFWTRLSRPPLPEGFAERVIQAACRRAVARPSVPTPWLWLVREWWQEQSRNMRAATSAAIVAGSLAGLHLSGGFPASDSRGGSSLASGADGMMAESLGILSGAPDGTLEQTYLAWAFAPPTREP